MALRDEILADSPSVYWRLGETIGTSTMATEVGTLSGTYDATNPPTLETASLIASDTANKCADFDGVNDKATRADDALLDLASNFAIEAWVTTDSVAAGDAKWLGKGTIGANGYAVGRQGANPVFSNMGVAHYVFSGVTLVVGTTYHMVFSFNSTFDVTLYLNGVSQGEVLGSTAVAVNATALFLGSSTGAAEWWDGKVDEVAIYPATLSAARALAHYNAANTAASTQYSRPDADVTTTGWTTTPLWSKIDEAVADDADFITATAV